MEYFCWEYVKVFNSNFYIVFFDYYYIEVNKNWIFIKKLY